MRTSRFIFGPFVFCAVALAWHADAFGGSLTLAWNNPSAGADGISVERRTGASGGDFAVIGTADPSATEFTDTSAADGLLYCYRVRAFTASEYSDYSNVACGQIGVAGPATVALSLGAAGSGGGAIVGAASGITCVGSCSYQLAPGASVVLTALPDPGSSFAGWSGAGCSGTGSCAATLSADAAVTAIFAAQPITPGSPPDVLGLGGEGTPPSGCCPAQRGALVAAVLPGARSVQIGSATTAFVSVLNAGEAGAAGVGISLRTAIPAALDYTATDPATNQPVGALNTPVDIAPGQTQTFLISIVPTDAFDPTNVVLNLGGPDTAIAPLSGVNTLSLSGSIAPGPDVVAVSATSDGDGIVYLTSDSGAGAFAVATTNVGLSGPVTVSVDTGPFAVPVTLALCQTDPVTGACLSAAGASLTTQIDTATTPTFAIFAERTGALALDPVANRIFVRFADSSGTLRGATSVAVGSR